MSVASPVIVVNSLVARGSVGGRASAFALERLGFPVTLLPTVLLPWHPGHGPGTRIAVDPTLIGDIAARPQPARGCLTGYFGEPTQVAAALRLVSGLGDTLVLCDPVMGDSGRFYVSEAVRDSVRTLARHADIVTPNRFELAFLAGRDPESLGDNRALAASARSLGLPEVIVTSAFAPDGMAGNLLVTPEETALVTHAAVAHAPHGTGDLLAALHLGHRLRGASPRDALARAAGAVLRLVTLAAGGPEMPFAAGQDAFLAQPDGIQVEAVAD